MDAPTSPDDIDLFDDPVHEVPLMIEDPRATALERLDRLASALGADAWLAPEEEAMDRLHVGI